ncbi:MAG: Sua5/YciO/YrdC/YwlC family protein, partial [Solirubrobacterales bacterium]|nr:Sua5/YciO/YrdC/YwlC family protein [Solirubrobacterales bacterium]
MKVVATNVNAGDAARQALESCISKGGVALFPADGLYGLACDPLNEKAIRR